MGKPIAKAGGENSGPHGWSTSAEAGAGPPIEHNAEQKQRPGQSGPAGQKARALLQALVASGEARLPPRPLLFNLGQRGLAETQFPHL